MAEETILEVLHRQGRLANVDFSRLKADRLSNREYEKILLDRGKVTRREIDEAYGGLLKLPFVDLHRQPIEPTIVKAFPVELIERLRIMPFAIDHQSLKVAVARPSRLKAGARGILTRIEKEKNIEIELAVTSDDAIDYVLARLSLKRADLSTKKISPETKNLISDEVALKHRLAVFEVGDGVLKLATDYLLNPELESVLGSIANRLGKKIELFSADTAEIDRLLTGHESESPPPKKIEPISDRKKAERVGFFARLFGADRQAEDQALEKLAPFGQSGKATLTIDRVLHQGEPPLAVRNQSLDAVAVSPPAGGRALKVQKADSDFSEETKARSSWPIKPKIESLAKEKTEVSKDSKPKTENDLGSMLSKPITDLKQLEAIVSEAIIPKIVAGLLSYALDRAASDIHLEVYKDDFRVRYRIDGLLHDIISLPLPLHAPIVSRVKILSNLKIDETRVPQDGRFEILFEGREIDLRVSSLPTVHGEKIVMRVLDKTGGVKTLDGLGVEGLALKLILSGVTQPYGIILATGPTGSGKSTTLYAILNKISTEDVNVVTLEDPVEYELRGVNQVQVKPKIGFTFAEGLRSVLRQDPNVVLVGEIRDQETAVLATHAALTGHLVLSTLHTNDAAGALPRLINMGVEPFLITSSINLVIAQRLVRRICQKCKEPFEPAEETRAMVETELKAIPESNRDDRARVKEPLTFYRAKGCRECNQGFKGRLGIYEVMEMSEEIERLALSKRPASELNEAARRQGMISLLADGFIKATHGLTTIEEVVKEAGETELEPKSVALKEAG